MTAILWDDVAARVSAPTAAPTLMLAPEPKQAPRPRRGQPAFSDPLLDGAARLMSIPLHQLYAALLRVGVLEVGK